MILHGVVKRGSLGKTAKVSVVSVRSHPVYGKIMRFVKSYLVHDDSDSLKKGDAVKIRHCSPLSRKKCWRVVYD